MEKNAEWGKAQCLLFTIRYWADQFKEEEVAGNVARMWAIRRACNSFEPECKRLCRRVKCRCEDNVKQRDWFLKQGPDSAGLVVSNGYEHVNVPLCHCHCKGSHTIHFALSQEPVAPATQATSYTRMAWCVCLYVRTNALTGSAICPTSAIAWTAMLRSPWTVTCVCQSAPMAAAMDTASSLASASVCQVRNPDSSYSLPDWR
jgi:hypothetical protein